MLGPILVLLCTSQQVKRSAVPGIRLHRESSRFGTQDTGESNILKIRRAVDPRWNRNSSSKAVVPAAEAQDEGIGGHPGRKKYLDPDARKEECVQAGTGRHVRVDWDLQRTEFGAICYNLQIYAHGAECTQSGMLL